MFGDMIVPCKINFTMLGLKLILWKYSMFFRYLLINTPLIHQKM
jgi:hypothetical protein